jgi:exodeoxyribonuclease VII large subunit
MKPQPHIYTVTEITSKIKTLLTENFSSIAVKGELTGVRRAASGHIYFQIKDEGAVLKCVMWRSSASRLRFELEDGLEVAAHGKIDLYPPRGDYQLQANRIEPLGLGELQLAFEQLKARLEKEGLFAPGRKRPLPFLPRRIGIVTSETGAALRDILRGFERRFADVSIVLAPSRVQGKSAAEEIAAAIKALNRVENIDVIIAGRGGGSLEDLWPFNEEAVARAIAASRAPVVSAVGHEIDFTISDFVADARAATPTAAVQMVVPELAALLSDLEKSYGRLSLALKNRYERARIEVARFAASPSLRRPLERIRGAEQELDDFSRRLPRAVTLRLQNMREGITALSGRLDALSPLAVLERGYSITRKAGSKQNLRSAKEIAPGDEIETRLAEGSIKSRVEALQRESGKNDGGKKG